MMMMSCLSCSDIVHQSAAHRRPKLKQKKKHKQQQQREEEEEEEDEQEEEENEMVIPNEMLMECLRRLPRECLGACMRVCRTWREVLQSPDFYQLRAALNHCIVAFGVSGSGRIACAVLNILDSSSARTCTWTLRLGPYMPLSSSSSSLSPGLSRAHTAGIMRSVYIMATHCTLAYDAWAGTIAATKRAHMLKPRKKYASCVIDGRIIVAGGSEAVATATATATPRAMAIADAEEYLPDADEWRSIEPMPTPRYACVGAAVDGVFYVLGGLTDGAGSRTMSRSRSTSGSTSRSWSRSRPYSYVASMDAYDAAAGRWAPTRAVPAGSMGMGMAMACACVGRRLYVLCSHAVEVSLWCYRRRSSCWARLPPPPPPLLHVRLDAALRFACVAVGHHLFVIQTHGSVRHVLARSLPAGQGHGPGHGHGVAGLVLIYDTKMQRWSRGADFPCIPPYGASAPTLLSC